MELVIVALRDHHIIWDLEAIERSSSESWLDKSNGRSGSFSEIIVVIDMRLSCQNI